MSTSYFITPVGLDVFVDRSSTATDPGYDALQATSDGTDTNGNVTPLFLDDFYCENLFFQVQGDDSEPDATPIHPLRFRRQRLLHLRDHASRWKSPNTGTVEITEPANLVHAWTLTNPANIWYCSSRPLEEVRQRPPARSGSAPRMRTSAPTSTTTAGAPGFRILETPIEAEFELVNDGTADSDLRVRRFGRLHPGQHRGASPRRLRVRHQGIQRRTGGRRRCLHGELNSVRWVDRTTRPIPTAKSAFSTWALVPRVPWSRFRSPRSRSATVNRSIAAVEADTTVRGASELVDEIAIANGYILTTEADR